MEKINLITPEDMATFDRIDRDCLKMHVCPPPKTFINMKVHDANGSLTLDIDMPSRSWVRNAYNMMAQLFLDFTEGTGGSTFGAGAMCVKLPSGSVYSDTNCKARAPVKTFYEGTAGGPGGIIIGTGNTAESFESYAVAAKVNHGTSSGQMVYNAQTAPTPSYDSGTKKWTSTITRIFNNNSGGDITVSEVALYGYMLINAAGSNDAGMVSRDLLSSPVTVANAAQLTVTYTIEMTFPA